MTSHFAETLTLMPIECHETVCFSGGVYTASDRYEKSTTVFEIVSLLLLNYSLYTKKQRIFQY